MKKISAILGMCLFLSTGIFAQAVSDRAVIPVAITLNQILRLSVTDGGNVEFVFNTIQDYEQGIEDLEPQHQTNFTVASSTPWSLLMYAEEANMRGTDDPTATIELSNFGFVISNNGGNHAFGTEISVNGNCTFGGSEATLTDAASTFIGCNATNGASNCAGDEGDNTFVIYWEAGTGEGNMIGTSFIDQGFQPDRYVVNTYLDLRTSGI